MPKKTKVPRWLLPLGIMAAGVGSVAAVMLRGCWHRNISWPIAHDDHYSYIVCTNCGIKRLFDEKQFHEYGPYGYEIDELIAQDRARHIERLRRHEKKIKAATAEPVPTPTEEHPLASEI
jgi:DNA-directed RNA polymerase subunit RPC12/RpoP